MPFATFALVLGSRTTLSMLMVPFSYYIIPSTHSFPFELMRANWQEARTFSANREQSSESLIGIRDLVNKHSHRSNKVNRSTERASKVSSQGRRDSTYKLHSLKRRCRIHQSLLRKESTSPAISQTDLWDLVNDQPWVGATYRNVEVQRRTSRLKRLKHV